MSERVQGNTMEILERIAAGHSAKSIADSLGITTSNVYTCQKRHPDLLNKIKHQRMDGTPDSFSPGYGCESVKHIEQPVEKPVTEPPRHSFGELFEKIKRLENRNKELEEKLQEKSQEKAAEPFKQSDLLGFLVRRTLAEDTTKEELMGIASTVKFITNAEAIKEAVNSIYEFEV